MTKRTIAVNAVAVLQILKLCKHSVKDMNNINRVLQKRNPELSIDLRKEVNESYSRLNQAYLGYCRLLRSLPNGWFSFEGTDPMDVITHVATRPEYTIRIRFTDLEMVIGWDARYKAANGGLQ